MSILPNIMQDKLESEAEELMMYIENDSDLNRQRFRPTIKNILRRKKSGKYDHTKAPKLWSYIVEAGAKKYNKEMPLYAGDWKMKWYEQLPVEMRECASHLFANKYFEEILFNGYTID